MKWSPLHCFKIKLIIIFIDFICVKKQIVCKCEERMSISQFKDKALRLIDILCPWKVKLNFSFYYWMNQEELSKIYDKNHHFLKHVSKDSSIRLSNIPLLLLVAVFFLLSDGLIDGKGCFCYNIWWSFVSFD